MKKAVSLVLAISLIFSIGAASFAQISDVSTHWAIQEISCLVERGILNGYPDGTFKPDNPMTKVEFYKVINELLGFEETAEVTYLDVKATDWYYENVAKALRAGYINPEELLHPNENITRQEAVRILSMVYKLSDESDAANVFLDSELLLKETKGYIGVLLENDLLHGYPDDTFKPTSNITRAEVVKLIYNVLGKLNDLPLKEEAIEDKPTFSYWDNFDTVLVSSITLSSTTMYLEVGGSTGTITPTISPVNASNKTVIWTSSDTEVATVTNGVITPVAAGTATITATTEDGGKTATTTVTVVLLPAEYTVTFTAGTSNNDLADITTATNYVATATVTEGVAYTAPVLSKEGYRFIGWFKDEDCTTEYEPSTEAITGNITLYANFIKQFTLTLTGPKISSVPAAGMIDKGTEVTVTIAHEPGQNIESFYVGGFVKIHELQTISENQYSYTFIIEKNTEIKVMIQLAQVGKPVWNGNTITWEEVDDASSYAVIIYKNGVEMSGHPAYPGNPSYDITDRIEANGLGNYTVEVRANANDAAGFWHGEMSLFSDVNVISTDLSTFNVALAEEGSKTSGMTFNLRITGAKSVLGNNISYGASNVIITSNLDYEVFNSKISINNGEVTVPIKLTTVGKHTLTVKIDRVTDANTLDVMVE